jgi:hypothetical protein
MKEASGAHIRIEDVTEVQSRVTLRGSNEQMDHAERLIQQTIVQVRFALSLPLCCSLAKRKLELSRLLVQFMADFQELNIPVPVSSPSPLLPRQSSDASSVADQHERSHHRFWRLRDLPYAWRCASTADLLSRQASACSLALPSVA